MYMFFLKFLLIFLITLFFPLSLKAASLTSVTSVSGGLTGLERAVEDETLSYYQMTGDETIDTTAAWVKGVSRELEVEGGGFVLNGSGRRGFLLSDTKTLTLKNLTLNDFDYAIDGQRGDLVFSNVSFTNNQRDVYTQDDVLVTNGKTTSTASFWVGSDVTISQSGILSLDATKMNIVSNMINNQGVLELRTPQGLTTPFNSTLHLYGDGKLIIAGEIKNGNNIQLKQIDVNEGSLFTSSLNMLGVSGIDIDGTMIITPISCGGYLSQMATITGDGLLVFDTNTLTSNENAISVGNIHNKGQIKTSDTMQTSANFINEGQIANSSDMIVYGQLYNGSADDSIAGVISQTGTLSVGGGYNTASSSIDQAEFDLERRSQNPSNQVFENKGSLTAKLRVDEGFQLLSDKANPLDVSNGTLLLKQYSKNYGEIAQKEIGLKKGDSLNFTLFDNEGTIRVANLTINDYGAISGDGEIYISGDSSNTDGSLAQNKIVIDNAVFTNDGKMQGGIENYGSILGSGLINITRPSKTTGAMEGVIAIWDDGSLDVLEDVSLGLIDNDGTLSLLSDNLTLSKNVSGDGKMIIASDVVMANDTITIAQKELTLENTGALTISPTNLFVRFEVENDGVITFKQGINYNDIAGEGITKIDGDVSNFAPIRQKTEVVSGVLKTSSDYLFDEVNLAGGDLQLTGTTIGYAITGSGVVDLISEIQLDPGASFSSGVDLNVYRGISIGTNVLNLSEFNMYGSSTLMLGIKEFQDDTQDAFGQINASTISISPSSELFLDIQVDEDLKVGYSRDFALLTGSISDDFNDENLSFNQRFEVTQTGTKGVYNIAYISTPAEVLAKQGGNENHSQTATAWDNFERFGATGTTKNVADKLFRQSTRGGDYVKSLSNVAPADADIVVGTSQMLNKQITNQVDRRLSFSGQSGGDGFSGRSGGNRFNLESMWAQILFNVSDQDASKSTSGFLGKTVGISVGADKEFFKDVTIGLGYTYSYSQIDSDARKLDVNGNTLFVYSKYKPDARFLRGVLSYSYSKYSEDKNVSGIRFGADYDTHALGVDVMAGYDFANGLTPEAGMRYLLVHQETYQDDAGQTVKTPNSNLLTAVLGLNYKKRINAKSFFFDVTTGLAATYDIVSDDVQSFVDLAGQTSYTVAGKELHRFGSEATIGFETHFTDWSLNLDYDFGLRENFTSHTVILKLKYDF